MKLSITHTSKTQAGFTLMELMLVLGIITLLIAAGLRMAPVINKAGKETTTRANIGNIEGALLMYQSKNGRLPNSLEKLADSGDINPSMINDAWNQKLVYVMPGKRNKTARYDLYSIGQNATDDSGNGDDIGNFETN